MEKITSPRVGNFYLLSFSLSEKWVFFINRELFSVLYFLHQSLPTYNFLVKMMERAYIFQHKIVACVAYKIQIGEKLFITFHMCYAEIVRLLWFTTCFNNYENSSFCQHFYLLYVRYRIKKLYKFRNFSKSVVVLRTYFNLIISWMQYSTKTNFKQNLRYQKKVALFEST